MKIAIVGSHGMVGRALTGEFFGYGYDVVQFNREKDGDFTEERFRSNLRDHNFDVAFVCAAEVGGILKNSQNQYDMIKKNLELQVSILDILKDNTKKVFFLGSSCAYPKIEHRKIKESDFLCGKLEPTNEAYAAAKISGAVMTKHIGGITLMPTNLYGPGDTYHKTNSHVVPALIKTVYELGEDSIIWMMGKRFTRRELMYVYDFSRVCRLLVENVAAIPEDIDIVNIGSGEEITVSGLLNTILRVAEKKKAPWWNDGAYSDGISVKWDGENVGVKRKVLDCSLLKSIIGDYHTTPLETGIRITYNDYVQKVEQHS